MKAKEILISALIKTKKRQKYAAKIIGKTPQKFWFLLEHENVRNNDFMKILDNVGIRIAIEHDDGHDEEIHVNSFDTSAFILENLRKKRISKAKAAKCLGVSPGAFSHRLATNAIKADDFLRLIDYMGFKIRYTTKETGEEIMPISEGYGKKTAGMVNSIRYNTATSNAISNTFYEDGTHAFKDGKALELYLDADNRYFFVEYHEDNKTKDKIIPVPDEIAAPFIERYGTKIDKAPRR